jgi:hypothetical protein
VRPAAVQTAGLLGEFRPPHLVRESLRGTRQGADRRQQQFRSDVCSVEEIVTEHHVDGDVALASVDRPEHRHARPGRDSRWSVNRPACVGAVREPSWNVATYRALSLDQSCSRR